MAHGRNGERFLKIHKFPKKQCVILTLWNNHINLLNVVSFFTIRMTLIFIKKQLPLKLYRP